MQHGVNYHLITMNTIDILKKIKVPWVNRLTQSMAKGMGVRADFQSQLERFYSLLFQVVELGDYAWLDP